MCTVTFLPLSNDDFVLTSNRDVGFAREKALKPSTYIENGVSLHYPRDGKAGGTWIGTSRNTRLICLLNGGFANHRRKEPYAKSRGIIVKELLLAKDFGPSWSLIELSDIEPFTLVVVEWEQSPLLIECVWDGRNKHREIKEWAPSIWSSSTLYTEKMKDMRRRWFSSWFLNRHQSPEEALDFHQNAGIGREEVDVLMRREKVGTVSITQVIKTDRTCKMIYIPDPLYQKSDK
jgi:hypothetical protein